MGSNAQYRIHRILTFEQRKQVLAQWRERGWPDVLVGPVHLESIFGETNITKQYEKVFEIHPYDIWKYDQPFKFEEPIYVRKDLLGPLHFSTSLKSN